MTGPEIRALYRYPVKGLSADPMDCMALQAGGTAPFDRAYAIENGQGRFDPENPKHLPKINFLMLMRNERLATLQTHFDEANETLIVMRDGKQVARGDLRTSIGRKMLEQFFAAYMQDDLRGAPRIVSAPGHSFSDMAAKCLHIINLASLREVERVVGRPLDPLRFRPNIVIDGAEPWAELDWIGRGIKIGEVEFEPFERTTRCAATDVEPSTGSRDMAIPAALQRAYGHMDFGIYARIASDGTIAVGQRVTI